MADLLAITYSEFDIHVGPQLKYAYPSDVLTEDAFESIADYVIVGKELCDRLITIRQDRWQILSYSIAIENAKYERNTMTFAFGFVLSQTAKAYEYGKVLKKIATFFQDLEIEHEFLSSTATISPLPTLLQNIYADLLYKHSCFLEIIRQGSSLCYLALKLYRTPAFLRVIEDYDVPMFHRDHISLAHLPWDISFQHLILHIDGTNHVKKIIEDAQMDLDFVKRSLALLEFYGAIILTDLFRFSNLYRLTTAVVVEAVAGVQALI